MPPDGHDGAEVRACGHDVTLPKAGVFHELLGAPKVRTKHVARQGSKPRAARDPSRLREEWHAEANLYQDAPVSTARRCIWHPEWGAGNDPVSPSLFERFRAAAQVGPTETTGGC